MTGIPDLELRRRLLDPSRSFLVQAPAGAGKTELLIQRYLRLLALVDEPEEVLAVTFTRKAAGELRRRVLAALAGEGGADALTGELAAAVRARDEARGWALAAHPARLRAGTLDAVNASIARSAPLSGGGSALRRLQERPLSTYRMAVDTLLQRLGEDSPVGAALETLLDHLDNRPERLADLLVEMLGRRDQWLALTGSGVGAGALRAPLERSLRALVVHRLERLRNRVPAGLGARLEAFVAALPAEVPADQKTPSADTAALRRWKRIADTFLVRSKPEWRRRLDRRQGVPAGAGRLREEALALLAALHGLPLLARDLHEIRRLPEPAYPDPVWQALQALLRVLPAAAAELKVHFAATGSTDFIEMAGDAARALGSDDAPGEAGLRLDTRVRHLLLDEFQDTSRTQFDLLRALTRGWSPGDGRTVFLVGDPMQSIYRFRQAEVRLFFECRAGGGLDLELAFARLEANFRSTPSLVAWVNHVFAGLLPATDEPLSGRASFAPAVAVRPPEAGGAHLHDVGSADEAAEGAVVAELVRAALDRRPEGTVGVLVRSRAHAAGSLAALQAARIPFSAPDLHLLGRTMLAADLMALTRTLVTPHDRLAWLGALRAPWCGLSLADLATLAQSGGDEDGGSTEVHDLRPLLDDPAIAAALSDEGRRSARRFALAWDRAAARLGELDLRDVVEGLWLALGGPAAAGAEATMADEFFARLDAHDAGGDCPDLEALAEELDALPATLAAPDARVQVMTIHKAKGLEFDTVVLPGLGRATRQDRKPALLWQELPLADEDGTASPATAHALLLAPLCAEGAKPEPLYELLWQVERDQALAETDRLLYVAATRAIRDLHLVGHLGDGGKPAPRSLLERLWSQLRTSWPGRTDGPPDASRAEDTADEPQHEAWIQPPLRRLPADWRCPEPGPPVRLRESPPPPPESPLYDWASHEAMHAGAVVHRWLQHLASAPGRPEAMARRLPEARPVHRRLLAALGVPTDRLDAAVDRVEEALGRTLADDTGRWLLSAAHEDSRVEFPLSVREAGHARRLVIDRCFVDTGTRWIVDYKTSSHEGGGREEFLRSEVERYRPQLDAYRAAFLALDPRPVRTALYFPLLGVFREVGSTAAR